jgi:hypothetical protein
MVRVALFLLMALLWGGLAGAAGIPDVELAQSPSPKRVAALQAEAARAGWPAVAQELHGVALGLYQKQGPQAQAWYYLFRWAELFGQTEHEATARWLEVVQQARVANSNIPRQFKVTERPLADFAPPELRAYMMGSWDFSNQFFTLLSPLDRTPEVISILGKLWGHDPAGFREHANLALAIAVVYDVPPPPGWPHGQVSANALPRRLHAPLDIFGFLVKSGRKGALLQPLGKLPASELKFVVDTAAGFDEMTWAQENVQAPLAAFGRVYDGVRYRRERIEGGTLIWPKASYRLPDILLEGGICVDQAYFASMVGKAKGVPTLLFRGVGLDGRHAWFGFLDSDGHWELDCGRYADQKLTAGVAFDPQTWTDISDHELQFLSEGFRRQPFFTASLTHTQFAALLFNDGDFPAAARAARAAVNIERRNLDAWILLIAAAQRMGAPPLQMEGALREAAFAFQRYPDLDAGFKGRLARSLRDRGQTSEADFMERSVAHKYESTGEDLTEHEASDILRRSMEKDDVAACAHTYFSVLNSFGHDAGMGFFDQVVRPYIEYLLKNGRPREAVQAITLARQTLRVEPDAQLDRELSALEDRAQQASR